MELAHQRARALLERMRQSPMRRGAIAKQRRHMHVRVSRTISAQRVPPALARRVAFQLVFKFEDRELGDPAVWAAIGQRLHREMTQLKYVDRLAERQIIAGLPKLSAHQIEAFLADLRMADESIARTILNASLQAADPLTAGRRYLAAYGEVVRYLDHIDPLAARTLANATFSAQAPRSKVMEFVWRPLRAYRVR
jgi:hypothetical protein